VYLVTCCPFGRRFASKISKESGTALIRDCPVLYHVAPARLHVIVLLTPWHRVKHHTAKVPIHYLNRVAIVSLFSPYNSPALLYHCSSRSAANAPSPYTLDQDPTATRWLL
jgi:hypothetical protein